MNTPRDDEAAISRGKCELRVVAEARCGLQRCSANSPLKELMDLNITNPNPGPHFDAFGDPPPPMISSEGIIAQDITQKFRAAAASSSTSLVVLLGSTHADDSRRLQQPWSPASSSRMATLLCSSRWGPLRCVSY